MKAMSTRCRPYAYAAEQGYAKAQNNLGLMYAKGQGVPKDEAEAVRWCRKAAEQGNAQAQFNLGVMYGKGLGVPSDDAEAYFWLNLGATTEDERAGRDRVGNMLLTPAKRLEVQARCREWVKQHPTAQK